MIERTGVTTGAETTVVTDTTACLPPEMAAEYGVPTVSLYVSIDGDQMRESEIDDYGEFFSRLRSSQTGATTSQPSVGDFIAVYEPILDAGREIVSVHLSAGISGTYEAAIQARERLIADGKGGERIQVFDSRTAAGTEGLCVLAAARAATSGEGGDQVVERLKEARESLRMWFAIDTLEYLRRGGRIGGAAALIGSAFKIKPILTIDEQVTPVEKVRTRARSIDRLCDFATLQHSVGADAWVVQHIQDEEAAAILADRCREIHGTDPLFVTEICPVLGAHSGPGVLGYGSVTASSLR